MFGSKNPFFTEQNLDELSKARIKVVKFLENLDRSKKDISRYLKAYDFFAKSKENGKRFDGATIVKDLVCIRNNGYYLDLDAMLHDYEYISGANRNYIKKWMSDLNYIKNMDLNGKGVRVVRLVFLTIGGFWLPIYKKFKK